MCADGISTTVCIKVYALEKSEIGSWICSMQSISYIAALNSIFTVIGGYKCGVQE